jgi:hypothetical protein
MLDKPMKKLLAPVLLLAVLLFSAPAACAFGGTAAAKFAREAIEEVAKALGKRSGRELAEIGGGAAVRRILGAVYKEGGEKLLREAGEMALRHGPKVLRLIEPGPGRVIAALRGLSPELVERLIRETAANPRLVAQLAGKAGPGVLEAVARHPGVGLPLVREYGPDAALALKSCSTDQAVRLSRRLPSLPAAERAGILRKFAEAPEKVLGILEKNPKTLGILTAAVVADHLGGKALQPDTPYDPADPQAPRSGWERSFRWLVNEFWLPLAALPFLIGFYYVGRTIGLVGWLKRTWAAIWGRQGQGGREARSRRKPIAGKSLENVNIDAAVREKG